MENLFFNEKTPVLSNQCCLQNFGRLELWNSGSDSILILGVKVENLKLEEQSHFLNVLDFQVSSQQILMIVAVSVINKSNNPFKRYLGENAVYNFRSNMIGESKYLSEVLKKRFNKTFGMTKQNN